MAETELTKAELEDPIFRTSPERATKMMVIMLSIMIVGGVIFFSMWDFWIASPAPVVQMRSAAAPETPTAVLTGKDIPVSFRI